MTRTLVSLSTSALAAVGIVVSTTAGCSGNFIEIGDLDASGSTSLSGSGGGTSSSAGTSSSGVSASSSGTGSSSTSSGAHSSSSGSHSSSSGTGSGSGGISSSSGSGSSSGGASSSSGSGSSSGGGSCCPSNWYLYQCSFPDGGKGFACHNPQLGCASSLTCGQGCDPVVTGSCGGGSSSSGGNSSSSGSSSSSSGGNSSSSSGGSTGLQWYTTCGPPVQGCFPPDGGLRDDAGAPCPPLGSSCSTQGELCGTSGPYACPVGEICSNQPMRICPVSSRKYKDDIQYVDAAGLQQLHDETLGIRLATYNYKPQVADPSPKHLGFIIEDRPPQSSAVDWSRERVDLYGYLSMVVATMQVQEKEIAELRQQLEVAQGRAQEQEPVCAAK